MRDVLRLGAHQLLATRVGQHAAVATSVDLAKDVCGPRPSGFVNAVLRRVATRDLDAWTELVAPSRDRDPAGYLAVRCSYPRWIVEAFREALGQASAAELEDALAAGNLRPEVTLAVTPGQADVTPGQPGLTLPASPDVTPTRWSPYGLRLAGGDPAPLVASGHVVVQDEASQLAALALTRVNLAPPGAAAAAPTARTACGWTCARAPAARPGCWPGWPRSAAPAWSPPTSGRAGPARS